VSAKERILALRLLEKQKKNPTLVKRSGLVIKTVKKKVEEQ